jgi:hypothetical protein
MATVSTEDIVAALGTSEHFPAASPQLKTLTPFIGHLVEIVGEDRLDEIVEVGNLCDVISRYLSWLAANDEFLSKLDEHEAELVKELYSNLSDQLKVMSDDPESALAHHGFTPETFLVSDMLGLNEAVKELARRGELTFARLLTTSPDVFIPKPN